LQPFTLLFFGAFAATTGGEALRVAHRGTVRHALTVWAIFPVLHVAHGVGFYSGLAHYGRHRDWADPERLPPRICALTPSTKQTDDLPRVRDGCPLGS
jgi:hypothetical protein